MLGGSSMGFDQEQVKSRIRRFLDGIERWRDEPDSPAYIDALISTPVRDLQVATRARRVESGATILEAIEAFKISHNIVVNQPSAKAVQVNEFRIFSRLTFLEHALEAPSFLEPLSSVIDSIPALGWVNGDETLDVALHRMISTGFEEVGIMDGGILNGVLHVSDIFSSLLREVAVCGEEDLQDFRADSTSTFKSVGDSSARGSLRIDTGKSEEITPLQLSALEWVESGWTQSLIICCILLDILSAFIEWQMPNEESDPDQQRLLVATGIILFVYFVEMLIRIFGRRWSLFGIPFELLDVCVVLTSVIVYSIVLSRLVSQDSKWVTAMRILRLMRQVKLFRFFIELYRRHSMRYRKDGFSLDLSYITSTCIAMSRPVTVPDADFSNRIREVRRFFVTKHPGRYLIFNLCPDLAYEDEQFGGNVERLPVQNHNPPSMAQMIAFVEHAGRFLDREQGAASASKTGGTSEGKSPPSEPGPVIAVHCTQGTGRTGVMVAAWLLYSTFSTTAVDAIRWFAARRVGDGKSAVAAALPMPSQRRYVGYMEEALTAGGYYTKRLRLTRVVVKQCPALDSNRRGCRLWFTVEEDGMEVYCSVAPPTAGGATATATSAVPWVPKEKEEVAFDLAKPSEGGSASTDMDSGGVLVAGDVRVVFYNRDEASGADVLSFFLCIHTGFVADRVVAFDRGSVDLASDDEASSSLGGRSFGKGFEVQFEFGELPAPRVALSSAARRAGVALGPFRRIQRPTARVTEAAALMRRHDLSVQARFATALQRRVRRNSTYLAILSNGRKGSEEGRRRSSESGMGGASGIGAGNESNKEGQAASAVLCCAAGLAVQHDGVRMYRADGERTDTGGAAAAGAAAAASMVTLEPLARSVRGLARSLVSGNKRRFAEDGFDLDLAYITPRIIAMGYPSKGLESQYRNSVADVYRFFQERHAAHYLIVNLCSEREYELDTFHGNCVRYPFPDHHPPTLGIILPCCARIHRFLQADPDNVVAVHCKAGKGRTGLMVVAYLMYGGQQPTAAAARHFYDWTRTKDGKGLTIISQIRYAHYFEQQLRLLAAVSDSPKAPNADGEDETGPLRVQQDEAPAVLLVGLRLRPVPRVDSGGGTSGLSFAITVKSEVDQDEYQIFESTGPGGGASGGGLVRSISLTPAVFGMGSQASLQTSMSDVSGGGSNHGPSAPTGGSGAGSAAASIGWMCHTDPQAGHCDLRPASAGGAVRVAGDFSVAVHHPNAPKLLHFWLNSALLTRPPPDMGGVARQLSDEDRAELGLAAPAVVAATDAAGPPPPGGAAAVGKAWSLALSKHEIDVAAKDKRCSRFDSDFKVEVLFQTLPGRCGTGPALEAARNKRLAAAAAAGRPPLSAQDLPLHREREGYRQFVARMAASNKSEPPPSLEEWLLGRVDPLGAIAGSSSPAAGRHSGSYLGSSSPQAGPGNGMGRAPVPPISTPRTTGLSSSGGGAVVAAVVGGGGFGGGPSGSTGGDTRVAGDFVRVSDQSAREDVPLTVFRAPQAGLGAAAFTRPGEGGGAAAPSPAHPGEAAHGARFGWGTQSGGDPLGPDPRRLEPALGPANLPPESLQTPLASPTKREAVVDVEQPPPQQPWERGPTPPQWPQRMPAAPSSWVPEMAWQGRGAAMMPPQMGGLGGYGQRHHGF